MAKQKKPRTRDEKGAPEAPVQRGVHDLTNVDMTDLDDGAMQDLLQEVFAEAEANETRREEERASLADDDEPDDGLGEELDVDLGDLDEDDRPEISIEPTGTEISISVGDSSAGLPSLSDDDPEDEEPQAKTAKLDLDGVLDEMDGQHDASQPEMLSGGSGLMLSDEDDDLAFPDHAYQGSPPDEHEAEVMAAASELVDEVELLRARVKELADREQDNAVKRRQLQDENETLHRQLEVYKARLIKLNDEFEAYRPRAERERQASVQRETDAVLRSVLPVVDNMELALAHASGDSGGTGIAEGVVMILDQFHKTLAGYGVSAVDIERGGVFDPNLHEAMTREVDEELEGGQVSRVLRAGYAVGDRLLRAARVAVVEGQPKQEEEPEREPSGDPDDDVSLDGDDFEDQLENLSGELQESASSDDAEEGGEPSDSPDDPGDEGPQEG